MDIGKIKNRWKYINIEKTKEYLSAIGVPDRFYAIGSPGGGDNLAITYNYEDQEGWAVFYSERGNRFDIKTFADEAAACDFFIKKVISNTKNSFDSWEWQRTGSFPFTRLLDYHENLTRGDTLRCKGAYPYEDYVDFMLVDFPDGTEQYSFVVVSGYKSGLTLQILPVEANDKDTRAVNIQWLKANWAIWVYPDCPLEEVYLLHKKAPEHLLD